MLGQVCLSKKEDENIFFQPTEPSTKDGIWFDTSISGSPELENFKYEGIEVCDNDTMFLGSKCKYDNSLLEGIYSFINAINVGDFIYYFGAKSSSTDTANKAYKVNILTKEKTTLTNMPDTFVEIKPVVVGENIYLVCRIGDGTSSSTTSLKLYKYSISGNTYTLMKTLGSYIWITVAVIGTDIYVSPSIYPGSSGNAGILFKYDTLTNTLSSVSTYDTSYRDYNAIVSVGEYIYMFNESSSAGSSIVYKYNPTTNTAVNAGSIPYPVYKRDNILAYGKYIYILGLNPSGSGYEVYNRSMFKYDTETNSCSYINNIPYYTNNIFNINGSIYLADATDMYRYYLNDKYLANKRIYITTDYDSETIKINEKFHVAIKYVRIFQSGVFGKYKTYLGDGTSWNLLT